MEEYRKYINALRKCAREHENDRTFTGQIIVSDLCRDTADLLEKLEQEPFKPMIEIDLYSVIKQKYIEREVLDEIRAEIEEQVLESLSDGGDDWFTAEKVNECLDIIDKYKAESEGT